MDKSVYFEEIDFLKGIAILLVVILYLFSYFGNYSILEKVGSYIHISHVIHIFMILIGFTLYTSTIKYNRWSEIFIKRLTRVFIPFIYVYALSFILLLITNEDILSLKQIYSINLVIGEIPTLWGGSYFIVLYIFILLLSPMLFFLYKNYSFIYVALTALVIDFVGELITYTIPIILSFLLALLFQFYHYVPFPYYLNKNAIAWNINHSIYSFYSLFLIYIFILLYNLLNSLKINLSKKLLSILKMLGRASLHIYLSQMLLFYVFIYFYKENRYLFNNKFMLFICIIVIVSLILIMGLLWYKLDKISLKSNKYS